MPCLCSYTYNLYHLIAAVNQGALRARAAPQASRVLVWQRTCGVTMAPAHCSAEPPVVIYNNDVSWEELERVLGEGSFDSGARARLSRVARTPTWRRADVWPAAQW